MPDIVDCYCTPGTERDTALGLDELVREMSAAGVARAVLAPQDREIALANRAGNERIAALAAQDRNRFIPACTVSPWQDDGGIALLRAAVANGARMLVLAPMLQGFIPTDEVTDPLLHAAAELRVPVYMHTGPHSTGGPTQVTLLAQRFPHTRFILAHAGTTDYAHDMAAILTQHRLPNVWYDLSLIRPWAVGRYTQLAGRDRMLFGTSWPRAAIAHELEHFNQSLPVRDHPDVYGGNLERLLAEVRIGH